jgi:NAD(P)-dependent dehydrogenase (short-subunit alcohol dehydrogenase family)
MAAKMCAQSNVRINSVCPGLTHTPFVEDIDLINNPNVLARIPIGRAAEAVEIAEAVAWLCSDSSSFVLGSSLIIDGGFLA